MILTQTFQCLHTNDYLMGQVCQCPTTILQKNKPEITWKKHTWQGAHLLLLQGYTVGIFFVQAGAPLVWCLHASGVQRLCNEASGGCTDTSTWKAKGQGRVQKLFTISLWQLKLSYLVPGPRVEALNTQETLRSSLGKLAPVLMVETHFSCYFQPDSKLRTSASGF